MLNLPHHEWYACRGKVNVSIDIQSVSGATSLYLEDRSDQAYDTFNISSAYVNAGLFNSQLAGINLRIGGTCCDITDKDQIDLSVNGINKFPTVVDFDFYNYPGQESWLSSADAGWLEVNNQSISASIVPIPAAVWLFGSALAGLGWMRRKQTA